MTDMVVDPCPAVQTDAPKMTNRLDIKNLD